MAYTSFYTLQVDWLVALLMLYVLCKIVEFEDPSWSDLMLLGCVLCALSLVKAVAIVMVLECLVIIAAMIFMGKLPKKLFIPLCITMISVAMFYGSWKIFCIFGGNTSYINSEFNNKGIEEYLSSCVWMLRSAPWWVVLSLLVSLVVLIFVFGKKGKKHYLITIEAFNTLFTIIMCETDLYGWNVLNDLEDSFEYVSTNYWHAFCTWGVNTDIAVSSYGGISTLECITFSVLIITTITFWANILDKAKIITIVHGFFGIIFCISHLSMYLYLFVGGEKYGLSAFNRYLALVLFPFVGIVVYVALRAFEANMKDIRAVVLATLMVMLMINYKYELNRFGVIDNTGTIISSDYLNRTTVEKLTDEIYSVIDMNEDIIYCVIVGGQASSYDHYMRYLLMPSRLVGYINSDNRSDEDVIETLKNHYYDYVFVYTPELTENTNIDTIVEKIDYSKVALTDSGIMILHNDGIQ